MKRQSNFTYWKHISITLLTLSGILFYLKKWPDLEWYQIPVFALSILTSIMMIFMILTGVKNGDYEEEE